MNTTIIKSIGLSTVDSDPTWLFPLIIFVLVIFVSLFIFILILKILNKIRDFKKKKIEIERMRYEIYKLDMLIKMRKK